MNVPNHEIELEFTFLAKSLPKEVHSNLKEGKELIDIYIPENDSMHPKLRLRKKGNSYQLTKKTQVDEGDASAHNEVTIELDESEFKALSLCSGKIVTKNRYNIDIEGYPAEVDVFNGDLEGLVLIDFEFSTKDEMRDFKKPAICGADVTQEDFIAGGRLAGKSIVEIKQSLDRLGYELLGV